MPPPPPLYLYFSFYYTIPRKFCQPLFSLASCISRPYIYISPFYYTTNYSICQYGCELRHFFLIKILNLLLKTPFYYTTNHSFYQYSCSFKANSQVKPPFCKQNTHLFYTILLLFLQQFFNNFSTIFNILLTFSQ